MSIWLDETIALIVRSKINLEEVNYRSIIVVFYDHLSNRNLAEFIASLYDLDANDIYFEVDKIMNDLSENDIEQARTIETILNQNGFKEWIESDEF